MRKYLYPKSVVEGMLQRGFHLKRVGDLEFIADKDGNIIGGDPVTAIAISTVAGVGGSLLSSSAQSKAAGKAADAQMEASRYATDAQIKMFKQTRKDMLPWMKTGKEAQFTLADLMGMQVPGREQSDQFGYLTQPFAFEEDPGYAFRQQEGEAGINRMASATGDYFSGQRGKALTEYNQDLASQEYSAAFERDRATKGDLYAKFSGMSAMGMGGTQAVGTAGLATAGNVGRNAMYSGQAMADMYQNQANATSSAYAGIGNAANSGIQNYMMYDYMKGR